jgi:uncharacterized protein YijF (DUF1287 family)
MTQRARINWLGHRLEHCHSHLFVTSGDMILWSYPQMAFIGVLEQSIVENALGFKKGNMMRKAPLQFSPIQRLAYDAGYADMLQTSGDAFWIMVATNDVVRSAYIDESLDVKWDIQADFQVHFHQGQWDRFSRRDPQTSIYD